MVPAPKGHQTLGLRDPQILTVVGSGAAGGGEQDTCCSGQTEQGTIYPPWEWSKEGQDQ